MIAKYKINYSVPFAKHSEAHHYLTDDPVVCEEFLAELLDRRFKIESVFHDGIELGQADLDRMLKTAAGLLAAAHLCRSLGVDRLTAHKRFGTPA